MFAPLTTSKNKTDQTPVNMEVSYLKSINMGKFIFGDFFGGVVSTIVALFISILAPIAPFIGFSIFAILVDSWLGKKAARKRGDKIIDSADMRPLEKMAVYSVVFLLCELLHIVFIEMAGFDIHAPFAYIAAISVARYEVNSIRRHVKTLTGVDFGEKIFEQLTGILGPKNKHKN